MTAKAILQQPSGQTNLLSDLDHHAERRGQIPQVVIFFESIFTVQDHKRRAFVQRKRAGMPRASMQLERARAVNQKSSHSLDVRRRRTVLARRRDCDDRPGSAHRDEDLFSALVAPEETEL